MSTSTQYTTDDFKKDIVVEELDPNLISDELMHEFEEGGFHHAETVPMDIETLFDNMRITDT